ncbi:hypothetical protein M0657_008493 [Pyricularia oryzae]|nr:hypothetical protein M0657_008493 [Pyricularia oryzae]KAI7929421.1 hypothetical protein M9X92_001309 [Pyricularia oryzae]
MEERGNIPVSLPVKNPTRSYWQDPPDQVIANLRSSPDLTQDADVVIIGSGITGAAIAWHLLQDDAEGPYPKVVMLEAREICSGATGRNGIRTGTKGSLLVHQSDKCTRSASGRITSGAGRFRRHQRDPVAVVRVSEGSSCGRAAVGPRYVADCLFGDKVKEQ